MTHSQLDTTNVSQKASPFPAGDHKVHINRGAQRHSKHKTEKNKKDPQKRSTALERSVENITWGLKPFNGTNLTLNSHVDKTHTFETSTFWVYNKVIVLNPKLKHLNKKKNNTIFLPRKLGNNICLTTEHNIICCFYKIKSSLCSIKILQPFQNTLITVIGQSWSQGYKRFHAQLKWAWYFNWYHKIKGWNIKIFPAIERLGVAFIPFIKIYMLYKANICWQLTYMSRINFMLIWVKFKKVL